MENEQLKQELENILGNAKLKIEELNQEYQKFADLRSELHNKAQGIRSFYSTSENKSKNIDSVFTEIQNKNQEIETIKSNIAKINQIINGYHQEFVGIKSKLDDGNSGLEVSFNWIQNKKEESGKKYEEIVKTQVESENLKKQIESDKTEIEEIKKKSEEFKKSIGETLDLVNSSSLNNSFEKRKKEITKAVGFWKWFMVGSLALLLSAILFIYAKQAESDGFKDWSQWYRYLFTTPVVYLVYLSSKNYNLERDLLERYSFKAVLSTSLRSYIKLLRDYFPDKKEELLSFTLESAGKIYCEPFIDKDKRKRYAFGINKFFNVNFEEYEKIKELGERKRESVAENNETKDKIL